MECPEVLYKYCKIRGLDILENRRIKVTPPAEFNDPFEFAPVLVGHASRQQIRKYVVKPESVREMYPTSGFSGSFGEYKKFVRANARGIADGLYEREQRNHWVQKTVSDNYKKMAAETTGVFCVSSRDDGILMWSHYADSHRGFLIGFDAKDWRGGGRGFFRVKYSQNRPEVDVGALIIGGDSMNRQKAFVTAITTKSPEWEYEKEYRAVFSLEGMDGESLPDGSLAFFFLVNPAIIREVVFGARCPTADECRIRSVLKGAHFSHVKLKRAVLDSKRFAICVEPA
jgi:Protein of unknown function (DUF2971)